LGPTLVLAASCSSAPDLITSGVSVVEAQLTDVQDVTGLPASPSNCWTEEDGGVDRICIDGAYRLTFTIGRTLGGRRVKGTVATIDVSAKPIVGIRYLLLLDALHGGSEVVWKGAARDGLCLEPELVDRYGVQGLVPTRPCRH
jgi:hypothetical protein